MTVIGKTDFLAKNTGRYESKKAGTFKCATYWRRNTVALRLTNY